MTKYTLVVDGMMCGMCESHVNDAVRKAFPVKKVTSSHSRKQTVVVAEEPIDEARLRQVIDATGYTVQSVSCEPYEKKGLFSWGNERNRGAERRPALRPSVSQPLHAPGSPHSSRRHVPSAVHW